MLTARRVGIEDSPARNLQRLRTYRRRDSTRRVAVAVAEARHFLFPRESGRIPEDLRLCQEELEVVPALVSHTRVRPESSPADTPGTPERCDREIAATGVIKRRTRAGNPILPSCRLGQSGRIPPTTRESGLCERGRRAPWRSPRWRSPPTSASGRGRLSFPPRRMADPSTHPGACDVENVLSGGSQQQVDVDPLIEVLEREHILVRGSEKSSVKLFGWIFESV